MSFHSEHKAVGRTGSRPLKVVCKSVCRLCLPSSGKTQTSYFFPCFKTCSLNSKTHLDVLQLPEFSVYTEYLKNHHAAILTINQFTREKKSFANWIQNV